MKISTKEIVSLLTVPLILVGTYLVLYILWKIFSLPEGQVLAERITQEFASFGLWVVFIAALIEGFFVLGQYFPGGAIIFLGVISSGGNVTRALLVVGVVSIAFVISYSLNYFVGKYGWYKILAKFGFEKSIESSREKLSKQGLNVILYSYWEPNLASMIATAAGILNIPFKRFLRFSIAGVIIWNAFWGALVFKLGNDALKMMGLKYVLVVFFVWSLVILLKRFLFKRV